ncbi:hypothetical protein GWI33_004728 [Rhynchophorus ferrugineus]|uniref:Enoyl reductase (ER) domain-containing protein n=1 Tax=Rhynchophorus ferrugineus TaxID=354439 RepID=A0A834ILZ3_RHYFE|nr:hypothetical protein GWI33_004728 [Rhynchophorus ferrugineus]
MLKSVLMFKRCFSKLAPNIKESHKILAWSIHSYGDIDELQLAPKRIPIINDPDEVLIQVKAASLNPIDSFMLGGYGQKSFQVLRNNELEFPLTLGRDFSGIVISKGHRVGDKYQTGDEVYGFIPIHKQGSFSEVIVASKCHILPKPRHLSHEQSASLVYALMTAWSGLFLAGNLLLRQRKGLRVLVLGGSGGVGSAAIQLLKTQGCIVYTTCSSDAVDFVSALNPDLVFDRNNSNFNKDVELEGKYHVILDAANVGIHNIPNNWKYETYITLNSPLLINNDKYGLPGGLLKSAKDLFDANIKNICDGKTVRWGYFVPSSTGFQFVNDLICREKIRPVIQKEFDFKDLPCAMKTLQAGHARGKIVITQIT